MSFAIMQRLKAQREAALRLREEKKKMAAERILKSKEDKELRGSKSTSEIWQGIPVLFLYGTQTGNAKEISEILQAEAKENGHENVSCMSMRDYMNANSFEAFKDERVVITVVSTTGQGDAPNNVEDFWRKVRRKKEPGWLSNMHFAVLGLGDTNYANFCAMGKFFDSVFQRLGGTRFFQLGLADDATGIDEVVEPWRKNILPALKELCKNLIKVGGTAALGPAKRLQPVDKPKVVSLVLEKNSAVGVLYSGEDNLASNEAKALTRGMKQRGLTNVNVMTLKDYTKLDRSLEKFNDFKLVAIIVSTSGPGEIPTNGMRFKRALKKVNKPEDWLQDTCIITLGLGNTSYENFCGCVKEISRRLHSLGAKTHDKSLVCVEKDESAKCGAWRAEVLDQIGRKPKVQPAVQQKVAMDEKEASNKSKTMRRNRIPALTQCRIKLMLSEPISEKNHAPHQTLDTNKGLTSRLQSHCVERERKGLSPDSPFMATVTQGRMLTSKTSKNRHVIHLEMSLPGTRDDVNYLPGDSVGIHCPNNATEVNKLLSILNLKPNTLVTKIHTTEQAGKKPRSSGLSHIFLPCSIENLLIYCVDITSPPKKNFLRMLAEYCGDKSHKDHLLHLSSLRGKTDYEQEILKARPPLSALLQQFSSCKVPLAHLAQMLPPLLPRYYSIASSPNTHPTELHIAFSLVSFKAKDEKGNPVVRKGLCTNWLYNQCSDRGLVSDDYLRERLLDSKHRHVSSSFTLPVFIRRGGDFSYPNDVSSPIVMVGPGTGVAPFRGFLHYRRYQSHALESGASGVGAWRGMDWQHLDEGEESDDDDQWTAYKTKKDKRTDDLAIGKAMLFYGCQHRDRDFLYKEELTSFEKDGTLAAFYTAFSREQEKKVYVQHKMEDAGAQIYELLVKEGGIFFVCGDGTHMASDVMKKVTRIFQTHGEMTLKSAKDYVVGMMRERRYIQDIWS